jgi:hypothetical protein
MSILYNTTLFYPEKPILELSGRMLGLKKAKYGNFHYYTMDGENFDSIAEYRRWRYLIQAQDDGEIQELERQPRYQLNEKHKYIGDFRYKKNGKTFVEDVKSYELMLPKKFQEIRILLQNKHQTKFLVIPIRWILSSHEVVSSLPLNS